MAYTVPGEYANDPGIGRAEALRRSMLALMMDHENTDFALWRQDKGHQACAAAFSQAVQNGGPAPISFDELREVSRVSIELAGK